MGNPHPLGSKIACSTRLFRPLPRVRRWLAAVFAAAAFAVTTPQSQAADPQPYTVSLDKTGNDALDQALHDSSNLVSLRESAPAGPFASGRTRARR